MRVRDLLRSVRRAPRTAGAAGYDRGPQDASTSPSSGDQVGRRRPTLAMMLVLLDAPAPVSVDDLGREAGADVADAARFLAEEDEFIEITHVEDSDRYALTSLGRDAFIAMIDVMDDR